MNDSTNKLPIINNVKPFSREVAITRVSGLAKSGFDFKELGEYAVNPSVDCECKCLYCSSHGVLGRLKNYCEHVGDWWEADAFVYYKNIVSVVEHDAAKLDGRDVEVVMSSVVDPWQSGLVQKGIPRAILERLAPNSMRIRLLTKMTAIARELPYVAEAFGDRATIGTSIPILNPVLSKIIEPFASPVQRRQEHILGTAKNLGLRRYVMGCPIIPGSFGSYAEFRARWMEVVDRFSPERIWFEPLNGRGKNLDVLEQRLRANGFDSVTERVTLIRTKRGWTTYTTELLGWVQRFARDCFDTAKTRFLLYPHMLTQDGRKQVEAHDSTVIWL